MAVLLALGVGGAALIGVALLATSLGLVVPVLSDAGVLARPVGRLALAGASAGEVAAVVLLSVGLAGGDTPLAGRLLLLALLLGALGMIALAVLGAEHSMRLTGADRPARRHQRADPRAADGAPGGRAGAGRAGAGVRGDPRRVPRRAAGAGARPGPGTTHPLYPVKLEAVGYGLLVPVFFVTSGLTLDLSGLIAHPAALAAVPAFLLALLVVRALPALAFRRELQRRELIAVGLLQATSLPFLLAAVEIGREMGLLDPAVGAGLVAAGLVSVLVFPAAALTLLPRRVAVPA